MKKAFIISLAARIEPGFMARPAFGDPDVCGDRGCAPDSVKARWYMPQGIAG